MKLFDEKKGIELTFQTIVIFIIMLVVLFVVVYFFVTHYSDKSDIIYDVANTSIGAVK